MLLIHLSNFCALLSCNCPSDWFDNYGDIMAAFNQPPKPLPDLGCCLHRLAAVDSLDPSCTFTSLCFSSLLTACGLLHTWGAALCCALLCRVLYCVMSCHVVVCLMHDTVLQCVVLCCTVSVRCRLVVGAHAWGSAVPSNSVPRVIFHAPGSWLQSCPPALLLTVTWIGNPIESQQRLSPHPVPRPSFGTSLTYSLGPRKDYLSFLPFVLICPEALHFGMVHVHSITITDHGFGRAPIGRRSSAPLVRLSFTCRTNGPLLTVGPEGGFGPTHQFQWGLGVDHPVAWHSDCCWEGGSGDRLHPNSPMANEPESSEPMP